VAVIIIPHAPGAPLSPETAKCRRVASAASYALPLANRINWLLAAQNGAIFHNDYWPNGIADNMIQTRIYHRRSVNCNHVLVIAQVDSSPKGTGYIKFCPDSGAGTTVTEYYTAARAATIVLTVPVTSAGLAYIELEWFDLEVRSLSIFEIAREGLDTTTDTVVALRSSSFAGLEAGRIITKSNTAGINDLVAGLASTQAAAYRHFGFLLPTRSHTVGWQDATVTPSWGNFMDNSYTGSAGAGLGMLHTAPMFRSDDTSQEYDVMIWARHNNSGAGEFRITSSGTGDAVSFSGKGHSGTYQWYSPDGGNTLDIDCTATDTILLESQNSNAFGQNYLASVQFIGGV